MLLRTLEIKNWGKLEPLILMLFDSIPLFSSLSFDWRFSIDACFPKFFYLDFVKTAALRS